MELVEDLAVVGHYREHASLDTPVVPVTKSKLNGDGLSVISFEPGVLINVSGIKHDGISVAVNESDVLCVELNGYFNDVSLNRGEMILRCIVILV